MRRRRKNLPLWGRGTAQRWMRAVRRTDSHWLSANSQVGSAPHPSQIRLLGEFVPPSPAGKVFPPFEALEARVFPYRKKTGRYFAHACSMNCSLSHWRGSALGFPRGEAVTGNGSSEPFSVTDEECGRKCSDSYHVPDLHGTPFCHSEGEARGNLQHRST